MIHINLLPVRQIKQRLQIRNEVAVFFASLFFLGLVISSVAMTQGLTSSRLTNENKALSTKKASYQPILNEIEKLKKDKAEQETKLDVIKKLKTGSQITVRVMDQLANITPVNRLWLTSMRQSAGGIEMAGIALDNATIAQFMQSITESNYFSGAELSQSQQIVLAGAKLKSFTLKVSITPPQNNQEAPAEEKK